MAHEADRVGHSVDYGRDIEKGIAVFIIDFRTRPSASRLQDVLNEELVKLGVDPHDVTEVLAPYPSKREVYYSKGSSAE